MMFCFVITKIMTIKNASKNNINVEIIRGKVVFSPKKNPMHNLRWQMVFNHNQSCMYPIDKQVCFQVEHYDK